MEFTSSLFFLPLQGETAFYRERVLWSFRVEKLTVTRTKENCDINLFFKCHSRKGIHSCNPSLYGWR